MTAVVGVLSRPARRVVLHAGVAPLATAFALVVFALVQVVLASVQHAGMVDLLEPGSVMPAGPSARAVLETSVPLFMAHVLVAGLGAVAHRRLFWAPVVAAVWLPTVAGLGAPAVLGPNWAQGFGVRSWGPWVGAVVDTGLVLVPAALWWKIAPPSVTIRRAPDVFDVATCSLAAFALWVMVAAPSLYGSGDSAGVPAALVVTWALSGVVLRTGTGAVAAGVGALVLAGTAGQTPWFMSGTTPDPVMLRTLAVLGVAFGLGVACTPAAAALRRASPVALAVIVNVANAADAGLTTLALGSGAAEANPVVRLLGLPAKLMIGLLVSVVVIRARPKALIVPATALGGVLVWHLAGLVAHGPARWW